MQAGKLGYNGSKAGIMLMEGRKTLLTPKNVGRKTMEANKRDKSGREGGISVIIAVLALVCLCGEVGYCRTITVQADGTGEYPTIQAAIDDANDGDQVVLEPGTYTGDGNRDINFRGKAITLKSETGPENCIIDCNGSKSEPHRGFYFYNEEGPNSVIDGITIANGFGPYKKISGSNYSRGGAVHCYNNASPTIKNCIIKDNQARNGGAIECYAGCSPVIKNCIFMDNLAKDGSASYGGAIYCQLSSHPKILNCLFLRNRVGAGHGDGGAIWSQNGGPIAINCDFISNNAEWGGAIASIGGSSKYTNCIFWDNYSPNSGDDIANHSGGTITIGNCHFKSGLNWPSIYNGGNLIDGGGNTSGNPEFVDFAGGDYKLVYYSPCIDTGTNETEIEVPETDLGGNARFVDGDGDGIINIDIGAYEFQEPEVSLILLDREEFEFFYLGDGQSPETQVLSIRKVGLTDLNWRITEDCAWLDVLPTEGSLSAGEVALVNLNIDAEGLANGHYRCHLIVSDAGAGNSPQTVLVDLYVRPIQAALDAAEDGDVVIIEPGVYTGRYNRDLDFKGKAITLRSIDPNDANVVAATIIDCNGTQEEHHRGFYFHSGEDGNSVVAGFTVVNGYARNGAGIYCEESDPVITNCNFIGGIAENWGGGIFCGDTSPVISSCSFTGNRAFEGAGITTIGYGYPDIKECVLIGNAASGSGGGINSDIRSTPTISNCIITSNFAGTYGGGGISIFQSNPTISNCLIAGNKSDNLGGGILQWYDFEDGSKIINCTIASNSASDGGAIRCTSKMTVVNSILWSNSAAIGGEVSTLGLVTFSYCDVKGSGGSGPAWNSDFGYDGGGNIDADPCFALESDYHLMPDSLCIDAGDPNYVSEPNETDLDGKPRVIDGRIDMGAYEYQGVKNSVPVACIVGGDRVVEAGVGCEAMVVLDGSCSSDADSTAGTNDDINDFDWYEVIDACEPNSDIYMGSGEVIECNLGLGEHVITLEVTDKAGAFDSNEVVITVEDRTAPVIMLNGTDMVVLECGMDSYVEEGATATDNCEEDVEVVIRGDTVDTSTCGTYVVTYDAADSWGNGAEQVLRMVVVEDTMPPEFSLVVEPNILWPPKGKMVQVRPEWEVSDNCDEEMEVSLVDVSMSAAGDINDYVEMGDDGSIYLRARKGKGGSGRVYTLTYEAVDESGNVAEASATVTVPHRRGPRRLGRGLVRRPGRQVYRRGVRRRGAKE